MNASRTARERARAELTREIKEEARRQLAVDGAGRLSLRAVARELGLVSSALYRYFPTRDDLLTALIIDAYDTLGAAAETADAAAPKDDTRARWRATYAAVRAWAKANQHEYALIYGSPVPGYQAPPDTIVPAARVARTLLGAIQHACATGALRPAGRAPELSPPLAEQIRQLAEAVAPEPPLPGEVLARAVIAFTQLFGMISFELFGQFVGSVDPTDEFFGYAVERMADFVGLPAPDSTKGPA
jgi:AcrR family transcriptional regulator